MEPWEGMERAFRVLVLPRLEPFAGSDWCQRVTREDVVQLLRTLLASLIVLHEEYVPPRPRRYVGHEYHNFFRAPGSFLQCVWSH
jgi:hypothetical protein